MFHFCRRSQSTRRSEFFLSMCTVPHLVMDCHFPILFINSRGSHRRVGLTWGSIHLYSTYSCPTFSANVPLDIGAMQCNFFLARNLWLVCICLLEYVSLASIVTEYKWKDPLQADL
ncbi:uncharacterized protein BP01DRAFT_63794 [Aspergillus saccharolyticus JOP 1030-1]|uniref:Uncharacterized protein n=1 Tax=Aspergillus saccharolyticus JOP 1030-1 TaxID=1450539 RepID=A0A318ZMB1_9EURO|nr:hypothetical protein BP01DRAFT_63794 [Aspergillus saccharolyticus JOP 1030-1]PYH45010.1 hypothetical protein BP01DRAFT_63794 [Aspergillus saccharolyticus JOP 1030-1]